MSTSYDALISQAREIVANHNKNVDATDQVNFDTFLTNLKKDGGSTIDALQECSYEDLSKCGLPRILSKQVANIFRQGSIGSDGTITPGTKKVKDFSLRELVEKYNPLDADNAVGKRLSVVSEGKPFIVLDKGSNLVVEATFTCLSEIKQHYKPREKFEIQPGVWVEVWKVGEGVTHLVDENPLYSTEPLRPDGTCDKTNVSWTKIPHEVRQFIRIALLQNEIGKSREDILDLFDRIEDRDDALNRLQKRYVKAAMAFDKLKEEGKLPVLKVKLGSKTTVGDAKKADPFFACHHKY